MFRLPWSSRRAHCGWCAFVLCCLVILTLSECGIPTTANRPADGENDVEVDPSSDPGIGPPETPDGDGTETDPILPGDDDPLDPELLDGESSQVFISGCEFTVFRLDGSLAPQPIQVSGPFNLTVRADVFSEDAPSPTAKLLGGDSLDGVLFIWNINGALTSGFLDTHEARSFQVSAPGIYPISLSLESEGDDIQCLSSSSGAPTYELFVLPMLSGTVTDASGEGITGASVLVSGEGFTETDVTEDDGGWDLFVPFEWSGTISVSHEDYTFDPENVSLEIVTEDTTRDFVGTSNVTPPSPGGGGGGCSPPDCDDNNECTADVCNGSTCSNTPVADGTPCDDGDPCFVGETCQSGSCTVGAAQDCSGLNTVCGTWSCDPNRPEGNCDTVAPLNESGACDDGRFCTVTDACSGGICVGTGDNCPGQACDEAGDACVNAAVIAGTVTFPATKGAKAPDGHVTVMYSEDGSSNTFTSTIDSNGEYSLIVPDNSSGAVAVDESDLDHCILITPNSRAYVNVTGTNNGEDYVAWCPPIGIPAPDFGIAEQAPLIPNPWNAEILNVYYVDREDVNATDAGNDYGTPALPRETIPNVLIAGDVVYLNGLYDRSHSSPNKIDGPGTANDPIFICAVDPNNPPTIVRKWEIKGTYIVLENLNFADDPTSGDDADVGRPLIQQTADHIAIRNCDISGNLGQGGVSIRTFDGIESVTDIVIYDCNIHDSGDVNAGFDQDRHGIKLEKNVSNIWVLDSEISLNSGDGIQVGDSETDPRPAHVYVGRNLSHGNKQAGFWCKTADHVVFSQNEAHSHIASGSSAGQGFGWQYDGTNIWFIFNHSHDNEIGLRGAGATAPDGTDDEVYLIGNVFNDLTDASHEAIDIFSAFAEIFIIDNTIANTTGGGIYSANNQTVGGVHISGNIIANIGGNDHVRIDNASTWDIDRCLFFDSGGSINIDGNDGTYSSLTDFINTVNAGDAGLCSNCVQDDPGFANAAAGNYDILGTGDVAGGNIIHAVYQTFLNLYGINIEVDFDRNDRGDPPDIGAFEDPD